ncbi:MAG TPA: glycerol-3-phosphate dehydrogenase/oxidase [Candidatus Eisenbacteria bacterium]
MTQTDLLILGGGITGAMTACLAARRGWSVTLLERGDLASGASGATSHMLHGGLRYLEHGRLGLVREALHERRFWLDRAPEFSRAVRFLVPLRRDGRVGTLKLRAGLWLYDRLAGSQNIEPASGHSSADIGRLEPSIDIASLSGGGAYTDGVVDDAGLAIALAREARAHGALIRTYREPISARRLDDGTFELTTRDSLAEDATRASDVIHARVIVNATGCWSDATRAFLAAQLGLPTPSPRLKPSRGVHLVYPALTRGHGILFFARSDGRVLFVVPFAGRSLVGTTEMPVDSPPTLEQQRPTRGEMAYLRRELANVIPESPGRRPLAVFSGIRPLMSNGKAVGRASREHHVSNEAGVISIAGGKYTTARVMANDVLEAAARQLGRSSDAGHDALPARVDRWQDGPDPVALADESINDLFARRLDDVMRRRSHLWLEDDRGLDRVGAVATAMGIRLGWSLARRNDEVDAYRGAVAAEQELIARSGDSNT